LCASSDDLHRLGDTLNIGETFLTPVCNLHQHRNRFGRSLENLLGLAEEGIFGKLIHFDNFSEASVTGTSIPEEDIMRSDSECEE
ncbi:hypothetical protein Taro_030265, partial [Colocasia esculenta]|nr:hypothetical protein [Colocasia esculenta]